MRKLAATFLLLSLLTVFAVQPSQAAVKLEWEIQFDSKPGALNLISSRQVAVTEAVLVSGANLDQVQEVYVDNKRARFVVRNGSELELWIPLGVNPGDAVLRLSGPFGLLSYQGLFEVLPSDDSQIGKVTIGSFQGFLAVYTKSLKGKRLSIVFGERTRVIPELPDNFTKNLTRIGSGTNVFVSVYVDDSLMSSEQVLIR